jgi:hypothetical protein
MKELSQVFIIIIGLVLIACSSIESRQAIENLPIEQVERAFNQQQSTR